MDGLSLESQLSEQFGSERPEKEIGIASHDGHVDVDAACCKQRLVEASDPSFVVYPRLSIVKMPSHTHTASSFPLVQLGPFRFAVMASSHSVWDFLPPRSTLT